MKGVVTDRGTLAADTYVLALGVQSPIRERIWKPALKRAGVRTRSLYQTRHTFATLALSSGEAIGWIAEMLGHANTEMVIRHYHKFIPNLTRQDGSALSSQIDQAGLR